MDNTANTSPSSTAKFSVLHWLDENFEKIFLVIGLLAIILFITLQTVYRYVITYVASTSGAMVWTEELSRYIFIWITYLALCVAIKRRSSIRVDIIYDKLPKRWQDLSWIVVHICFLVLTVMIAVTGWSQIERLLTFPQYTPAMRIPFLIPYLILPIGFGLIFQGIVAQSMTQNGMAVTVADVASVAWIAGLSMVVGLVLAVFYFTRRPRTYLDKPVVGVTESDEEIRFGLRHWVTLGAIVAAVAVQIMLESLPLAALLGLIIMLAGGAFQFKKLDDHIASGISMMGFIAFVMLIAGGYAAILKETGAVNSLIEGVVPLMGESKWVAATIITLIGLLVTMGIGTSFGTVPILAVIYVPLCTAVGFSVPATILLMTIAGALGDAGSPASDSTLGPTSGLNADGQHNHIWDTCVPTFLAYNVTLLVAGIVVSQFI